MPLYSATVPSSAVYEELLSSLKQALAALEHLGMTRQQDPPMPDLKQAIRTKIAEIEERLSLHGPDGPASS